MAVVGLVLMLAFFAVQYLFTGQLLSVHDARTHWFLLLTLSVDFFSLNAMNIAFQSDASGFVSVIGYMIVVYGFMSDIFIFKVPLEGRDMAGAVFILAVTVCVTVYKMKNKK